MFLAWFLNHHTTQKILKVQARGTSIVSISKAVLEELEMEVPSVEIQHYILKIASLRKQEVVIKNKLNELQEQYIQTLLIQLIKKNKKND